MTNQEFEEITASINKTVELVQLGHHDLGMLYGLLYNAYLVKQYTGQFPHSPQDVKERCLVTLKGITMKFISELDRSGVDINTLDMPKPLLGFVRFMSIEV